MRTPFKPLLMLCVAATLSSCRNIQTGPTTERPRMSGPSKNFGRPHIEPLPPATLERFRNEKTNFTSPAENITEREDGSIVLQTSNSGNFRLMPAADVLERAHSYPGPQPILPEAERWIDYISANPFLAGGSISPDILQPPPSVSHASRFPAPNQGPNRMTCVAFAIDGAIEMWNGISPQLSAESSYHLLAIKEGRDCCQNAGNDVIDGAGDLKDEELSSAASISYRPDPPQCLTGNGACKSPPHTRVLQGAPPRFKMHDFKPIASGNTEAAIANPAYVEALLAGGDNIAVLLGVNWRNDVGRDGQNGDGIIDVTLVNKRLPVVRGLHAVLITGYDRTDPKRPFFIIQNSFGPNWAHNGMGYLSYDYVMAYAIDGIVVEEVTSIR